MNKKVLFFGFGIDPERKEAISLNTIKLIDSLKKNGIDSVVVTVGYPKGKHLNFGKSMTDSILNRKLIIGKISDVIVSEKITHIHDLFVLPFASELFTIPLKLKFRDIKFIKEFQNDAGFSKKIHPETLLRVLFNRETNFKKIINNFDVIITRNKHLASKRNFIFLPTSVSIYPEKKFVKNKVISICYLGHPLAKKGIDIFPKLFKELSTEMKKMLRFNFAFSSIGPVDDVEREFKMIAQKNNVQVHFERIVKPWQFFRQNDVYILPIHDTFGAASTPNTVLEAMEAGCLVIVTEISSLKGVIENGKNGLSITQPNAKSVMSKLEQTIVGSQQFEKMVKNARKYIEENCTEKNVDSVLMKIYE